MYASLEAARSSRVSDSSYYPECGLLRSLRRDISPVSSETWRLQEPHPDSSILLKGAAAYRRRSPRAYRAGLWLALAVKPAGLAVVHPGSELRRVLR
jgi:hypothetical protein